MDIDEQTSEMITSNCSLLLMGALIISNIRGFALTAHKFLRIFFKSFLSQFVSSEFTLLITAEIVGIYFTSSFFMLQLSLADKYRSSISKILSGIDMMAIYKVFDQVLIASILLWSAVLYTNLKYRHAKYSCYATKVD